MRHLTSLYDLTVDEIHEIFIISAELKQRLRQGDRPALMQGAVLTQVFEKPSLRTRVSFEAAAKQLGGGSLFLSSKEAGLEGRESPADVARVLSGYSDVVVLRTFTQELIDVFAQHSQCPIINGLSDNSHPCQALTDLFTLTEVLGDVRGRKFAYVGDGNNVALSLAIICAMLGVTFVISSPPGYELNEEFLADLKQRCPATDVTHINDPQQAVVDADVVYTDVWASMGQENEVEERRKVFSRYQVNQDLMARAPSSSLFMHCLPAKRGLEVTEDVIDGPQSIAFTQAENRMHLAKGLLVWLLDIAM